VYAKSFLALETLPGENVILMQSTSVESSFLFDMKGKEKTFECRAYKAHNNEELDLIIQLPFPGLKTRCNKNLSLFEIEIGILLFLAVNQIIFYNSLFTTESSAGN
jgi:hypothetical protein